MRAVARWTLSRGHVRGLSIRVVILATNFGVDFARFAPLPIVEDNL